MSTVHTQSHRSAGGNVAVLTIDNPPVNAPSWGSRRPGAAVRPTPTTRREAMVHHGAGKRSSAGADIREFGTPDARRAEPAHVITAVEAAPKPVVAAIHGTALGGGLEIALGCHYRVAAADAKLGLPEVKLGIFPAPAARSACRACSASEIALEDVVGGKPVARRSCSAAGVSMRSSTARCSPARGRARARTRSPRPGRSAGARPQGRLADTDGADRRIRAPNADWPKLPGAAQMRGRDRGACSMPFDRPGVERELFAELMRRRSRAALIHAFFAEREAAKVPRSKADVAPRADPLGRRRSARARWAAASR